MAEQEEPVRRRVALKVIKLGMDTRQVIARFEAERQALALMDHPNIAKVLDAGATDTGRPFFVMELVRGIKITEFCDQKKLSTRERLDLFMQVCSAIQHAHQKGIIHRDIKPSNILVTLHDGVPVPKVIDFGIAKATTNQRLTDKTLFTQYDQLIGTPAYMSPEQAELSGLDIDTRTDIYALGVLLYEILTGKTPFDARELLAAGLEEMRRTIREVEPVRPSTRLSTMLAADLTAVAQHQQSDAPKLVSLLRGDLDWIVMKALEKDRTRRYETANGLAMDIKRHLNHETVIARPPSAAYRFQKMVRRNKLAFAAAAGVLAALLIGLGFSMWSLFREREARAEADSRRGEAEQARASETKLRKKEVEVRQQAVAQEQIARQMAYASDMNLAQQSLAVNNLGRAQDLLFRHRPQSSQPDLQGWEWRYLWQQCQSDELRTLYRTNNELSALSLSGDGKFLAVADSECSVAVLDLTTRQMIPTGRGAGYDGVETVKRISFSPLEPLLAFHEKVETNQFTITLWNAAERKVRARFPAGAQTSGVAFTSDGRQLAIFDEKGLKLRDTKTGSEIATLSGEPGGRILATDLKGETFAYSSGDGKVRVIRIGANPTNYIIQTTKEHVVALAFSRDGQTLAAGAGIVDSVIKLWDVKKGSLKASLDGHRACILGLEFSPDGRQLASASADQTIRLWDWENARSIATLRGHAREVWAVAYAPDGRSLFSASPDGSVRSWDTSARANTKSYSVLPVPVWRADFLPDSRSLAVFERNGAVGLWDVLSLQPTKRFQEFGTNKSTIALSPDGRWLVAGGKDGRMQVWDLTRQQVATNFMGFDKAIHFMAFHSGGKALVAMTADGNVRVWQTGSWQESWAFKTVKAIGFGGIGASPESGLLAVSDGNGNRFQVWNLIAKKQIGEFPLGNVQSFAFDPGGKWMAAGSWAGNARLWSLLDVQEKGLFHRHLLGVHSVAFSPDGKRLATGSNGREAVRIWDVATQMEMINLEGEGAQFYHTVFSPDGNWLVSVNDHGLLHLWRAPSWTEIEQDPRNGNDRPRTVK